MPKTPPPNLPKPPKPVTTVLEPPVSDPKLEPETEPVLSLKQRADILARQMRQDIANIGLSCASNLRCTVDRYLRCISPAFAGDGDEHFPITHRRAVHHRHACSQDNRDAVLCFHIGEAILAYYNLYREMNVEQEFASIAYLHEIATLGLDAFKVFGTASGGYRLLTSAAIEAIAQHAMTGE